jgi:hypothetical protein
MEYLKISVIVSVKDNAPCIELRRTITDPEILKMVVQHAWRGDAIAILPSFSDKVKSINSLIDKGILYREGDKLYFV